MTKQKLIIVDTDKFLQGAKIMSFLNINTEFHEKLPCIEPQATYVVSNSNQVVELYQKGAGCVFTAQNMNAFLREIEAHFANHQDTAPLLFPTFDIDYLESLEKCHRYSSNANLPLLLLGESGTGKTHFAHLLHQSQRPKEAFISVNLLELNPNLFESELFGHKKGAFTGALQDKVGLLEKANGGTLFLDEIGALPLSLQSKLLKIIEEKEFSRVGESIKRKSHFHLISATCENLRDKVQKKEMRRDFFFRISGYEMEMKALRERACDIPLLIEAFQKDYARQLYFSPEAILQLKAYHWPGNIRELAQLYHRLQCENSPIIKDLSEILNGEKGQVQRIDLPKEVERLEIKIFEKEYARSKGRPNKICQNLNISKSVFYRLQERLTSSGLALIQ